MLLMLSILRCKSWLSSSVSSLVNLLFARFLFLSRIVAVLGCVKFWSTLQEHQHPTTTHKAKNRQQYTRTGQERNL